MKTKMERLLLCFTLFFFVCVCMFLFLHSLACVNKLASFYNVVPLQRDRIIASIWNVYGRKCACEWNGMVIWYAKIWRHIWRWSIRFGLHACLRRNCSITSRCPFFQSIFFSSPCENNSSHSMCCYFFLSFFSLFSNGIAFIMRCTSVWSGWLFVGISNAMNIRSILMAKYDSECTELIMALLRAEILSAWVDIVVVISKLMHNHGRWIVYHSQVNDWLDKKYKCSNGYVPCPPPCKSNLTLVAFGCLFSWNYTFRTCST